MKKNYTLIILAVLLVLSSSAYSQKWFTYKSDYLGFKAEFPDKPSLDSQVVKSEIGDLNLRFVTYDNSTKEIPDNFLYMIVNTIYPDSLISSDFNDKLESFFENSINGAVSNVSGKLISSKKIVLQNYPGMEANIDYDNGKGLIRMRIYLVKNVAYILETICDGGKGTNKLLDKFFNSFSLLKTKSK